MERFKAVEKEMKTKAYSKEGLQLASKIDPKDKERMEVVEFLQHMNEELERQIETLEAEAETMQVVGKKSKKADASKAERIAEMEETVERHRWHQTKLELLQRALENSSIDTEQVKEIEESIKYYVEENQSPDFMDDDTIYDELNLQEEEVIFGMGGEMDRVSSQDTQSIQDETPELEGKPSAPKPKVAEPTQSGARRPSTQLKSPLPALATLHTPLPGTSSSATTSMKPAPLPTRTPGEPLKYASAAAAAAASDKNGVGIAPLPPPPGGSAAPSGLAPAGARASASTSPATTHPKLAQTSSEQVQPAQARSPAATPSHPVTATVEKEALSRAASAEDAVKASRRTPAPERLEEEGSRAATPPLTNGDSHAEEKRNQRFRFEAARRAHASLFHGNRTRLGGYRSPTPLSATKSLPVHARALPAGATAHIR
jgi:CCR4-NOT transcription complex subunit 3